MSISRRKITKLIGASALALTIVGAGAFAINAQLSTPAQAEDFSDLMEPGKAGDKVMGSKDAPVTIIEYSSMTCPHCAAFHSGTLPALKKKYIDTGKAKLVFREFPVSTKDLRSVAAFMLARCADEDKYFPLVDVLYSKQAEWSRAENPIPILLNIAKLAGFSQESFNACLKNQEVMDTVISVRNKAAKDYGVTGTPTFFINGKKQVGNTTIEEFSKLIDSAM